MNELLSIIIPVYQSEKYIENNIKSIINQSYTNIEIILVNDGSLDNSLEICNRYKRTDNRIVIINKENGGLSSARNAGIKYSHGSFIGFVDSDDYIDSDMYEKLYCNLIKTNSDISLCGVRKEFINEKRYSEYIPKDEILSKEEAINKLFTNEVLLYTIVCNKLFRRELFDNIMFKEGVWNEDEEIIHKLYIQANYISSINDVCYHYQIRDDNYTNKKTDAKKAYYILSAQYDRYVTLTKYGNKKIVRSFLNDFAKTYSGTISMLSNDKSEDISKISKLKNIILKKEISNLGLLNVFRLILPRIYTKAEHINTKIRTITGKFIRKAKIKKKSWC